MERLYDAIQTTPIIDHHAHNLLVSSAINSHDLLSMTSEATGPALQHSTSSLAHMRAVKQLASILDCENSWSAVQKAIELERTKPDDAWARRCFEGIETVLIDDGLDPSNVYPYQWHDRLTRSKCKRILRIERIAESLVNNALDERKKTPLRVAGNGALASSTQLFEEFNFSIHAALDDPEIVGFKSVICYRTGLALPKVVSASRAVQALAEILDSHSIDAFTRLEHEVLSPYFVHLTASAIAETKSKKPFQFHTGLGDNDINLGLSNPSHLQPFIEAYPSVPFVLLHASYPFTTEAGYLASVFPNVFLDIGEVFPFVSQSGQEKVISDAFELCPAVKLTWSTDGHWYPETYLLAVLQIREGLTKVLDDFVRREALTIPQAVTIVEAILFTTSNELYQLGLELHPVSKASQLIKTESQNSSPALHKLESFLGQNPFVNFLRLQWLDYTATLRARVLPIKQALNICRKGRYIGITKGVLGLLQIDEAAPGFGATGEYNLCPDHNSLRKGVRGNTAIVQCEFREGDGTQVAICPRTILRKQIEKATSNDMSFLVGSEIEVVFLRAHFDSDVPQYSQRPVNTGGHNWSSARALQGDSILDMLETIVDVFERTGIELQQFHSESSPGQYEFILAPLPPLQAIDTLIAAREIISNIASNVDLRATLFPKPATKSCGTGAHLHLSIEPATHWKPFYAGVLKHLRAIAAFTYSNEASYERVQDGVWAGGTWCAWGTQNRETPLRRIEGSHFEIKCIDGLANPYLALAAIIAAGTGGVLTKEPLRLKDCPNPPSEMTYEEREVFGIKDRLPRGFNEALQCLRQDKEFEVLFGKEAVNTYLTVKEAESRLLEGMEPTERKRWLIERY